MLSIPLPQAPAFPDVALADAMDQFGTPLLRTALLLLGDRRDAEEAVADTFVLYYRKLESFRGECSLSTWLTKILINCCRQRLRSPWRRRVVPTDQDLPAPDPFEPPQHAGDRLALTQAIASLGAKDREVILLFYYRDMTIRDMSFALGQGESTVRSRLTRAREALRQRLKEDDFDE